MIVTYHGGDGSADGGFWALVVQARTKDQCDKIARETLDARGYKHYSIDSAEIERGSPTGVIYEHLSGDT